VIAELSRDQIVKRFEEWLDRALASEEPPAGIDAEILSRLGADAETDGLPEGTSSYALWAAMTALTQEVKLQGRAFKELRVALDSQTSRIADQIRAEYGEWEGKVQRDAERRCQKEILGSLLDLRDRLERGLASAQTSAADLPKGSRRGWLERLVAKPSSDPPGAALAALIKGYELGLDRLDQTLDGFNVRPIRSLGQPFDPRRMNAVDTQESGHVPEGTVLEVYRSGYEWNGEVFRSAQVKVSVAVPGVSGTNE
jgi:molecular chaperone GrpE